MRGGISANCRLNSADCDGSSAIGSRSPEGAITGAALASFTVGGSVRALGAAESTAASYFVALPAKDQYCLLDWVVLQLEGWLQTAAVQR